MSELTKEKIQEALQIGNIELNSSHTKLSIPIINRIFKKMQNGIKFDNIKVCENLIIDGHHRYVSSVLANVRLDRAMSSKTSATNEYKWSEVEFVDEEWDTEEKIKLLNELDANFNNLPLEKIIEITK